MVLTLDGKVFALLNSHVCESDSIKMNFSC